MSARYVVEIHDVSPAIGGQLDTLLGLVAPRARERAALLVVPNWGGRHPITRHPDFISDIAARAGERVLHGLTHTLGPSGWNAFWYGTEDEGEFSALSRQEADARLREAISLFGTAFGEQPRWFCSPRWQESSAAAAAIDAAIPARLRRNDVRFAGGDVARVPALWFDDGRRSAARTIGALMRVPRRLRLVGGGRAFRLVIHPRDLSYERTRRELRELGARLDGEGWTPVSLAEATGSLGAESARVAVGANA